MSGKKSHSGKSAARPLERKAASQWLGSNMAQFMVLLNGLILTFTAFATLNVFISQIVQEGITSVTYETREHLNKRFTGLEKGIQTASSLIQFSGQIDSGSIAEYFKSSLPDDTPYERIFWLEKMPDGNFAAHRLVDTDANNSESADDISNEPALHRFVVDSMAAQTPGIHLLSEYKGFVSRSGQNDYPLIVASLVPRENGNVDIVYGATTVSRVISPAFFSNRKNILSVTAIFGDKGMGLYKYSRSDIDADASQEAPETRQIISQLGDKSIRFAVGVEMSERELFLEKIPGIMLLFGIVLTFIGTLYVSNNQRQSVRLGAMNDELARKNKELNFEISEREKFYNALRKTEKENRALIDAVSDIIFETATDGRILFLNDTWQKTTGFESERSIGRNLFDYFYMQDQAEQRNSLTAFVKGKKQSYRTFTKLRAADGTFRAVELAISMMRQDENKEMRIVGTITDVEERRRTERALSEAEKKYRAIVENSPNGIYQVTPEGHYLSVNAALAKILGYDGQDDLLREVVNANIDVYYDGRERERQLREALKTGVSVIECRAKKKDGSIIWIQESLRAVKDDDAQLLFFEGSIEDITARKMTELALREAKIQSDLASRAKSEFLANMSHELRTPLNAIIGFSDIIQTEAFGEVGKSEYLDYAKDINQSGKRLLQVINDILDVSRIEVGERQLNEGMVDLEKIVSSSLDMLAPKIEAQKTVIQNFVGPDTARLIGEGHAIKQMVVNLLSNAVKFTPEGGRVSIHAEMDSEGQMHVSVTDTGIGLTDVEIEKALSPFGQVNSAFNREDSGTGLGLTLVQSLMTLHGGAFELFSQKGVGTTATLIFPTKRVSSVRKSEKV